MAGKTGSVDIMAIDQGSGRLYLSDHTTHGVDVVDLSGRVARYLKTVPVDGNPNGLVVAGDLKLVFTGNVDATVSVIDVDPASPSRDTVVATLDTKGFGADELTYDPSRRKVFVASVKDGSSS
jgi:DNA-binding beta-propeller fold protein YncE